MVKNGLKNTYALFLAGLINALEVIQRANLDKQATFLALSGKKNHRVLGQEGARVKKALQALHALDQLLIWQNASRSGQASKKWDSFSTTSIKQGLKHYNAQEIKTFLEALIESESSNTSTTKAGIFRVSKAAKLPSLSSLSEALIKEVVQFMIDLFDFDYKQQMVNAVLQHFKNSYDDTHVQDVVLLLAAKPTNLVLLALKQSAEVLLSDQERILTQDDHYREISELVIKLLSAMQVKRPRFQLQVLLGANFRTG